MRRWRLARSCAERVWRVWPYHLKGYFSEPYGLFLDGAGATLCEYWYLMNVTAMAYGLIRLRFAKDRGVAGAGGEECDAAEGYGAADSLRLQQPGLRFCEGCGLYQPRHLPAARCSGRIQLRDAAGVEADRERINFWRKPRSGSTDTLHFAANPWYEVPSGAMAVMAAARLEAMGHPTNARKALWFCARFQGRTDGDWAMGRTRGQRADGRFLRPSPRARPTAWSRW